MKFLQNSRLSYIFLVLLNAFTWYPALNYWFFRNWEQSYLIGHCGGKFDFICMMRSHGLLYWINYKIFGWEAWGWYLTAIILFTISTLLVYKLTFELTKNRIVAFVVGVLFSVNVAHNDVVLWGSFEGLYAILMISFLLGVLFYKRAKEALKNKNWKGVFLWYFLILVFYSLSLFIRENAILLPGFILLYEWYTNKFKLSKGYVVRVVKLFLPMALLTLGYLWLRRIYGGSPNDFIDSMVRLRISLWRQGLWGEYALRSLIYFGKFAGSHVIPYPFMNKARAIAATIFNPGLVAYWFFTVVGVIYVFVQGYLIRIFRTHKRTFYLLLFSFLWFLLPTTFYSLVFSLPDNMIIDHYAVDTTRWRYFAFFGTTLFWTTIGWRLYDVHLKRRKTVMKKLQIILIAMVVFVVSVNFNLLRSIQKTRYEQVFRPTKEFYTTFQENFPRLPEDFLFYGYANSQLLSDYLTEWYAMREVYNPELVEERTDWAEGNVAMLLRRIREEDLDLSKIFFLDHTVAGGLVNKTEKARKIIRGQRDHLYNLNQAFEIISLTELTAQAPQVQVDLEPQLEVEIPRNLQIYLGRVARNRTNVGNEVPQSKVSALTSFTNNLLDHVENSDVEVCATAPLGSRGLPAEHLVSEHLIDGNLGGRSVWTANCWDAWVVVDLGGQKTVYGSAYHTGEGSPGIPAKYDVLVSNDMKNWQKVASVSNNLKNQRIDLFDEPVNARYVKLQTYSTTRGGWLTLDEFFVFDSNGVDAAQMYDNDFEMLLNDSRDFGSFMRITWVTEPYDTDSNKEIYIPIMPTQSPKTYIVKLNESEIYSHPGDFLVRKIGRINIDFVGSGGNVFASSVKIVPRYPVNE